MENEMTARAGGLAQQIARAVGSIPWFGTGIEESLRLSRRVKALAAEVVDNLPPSVHAERARRAAHRGSIESAVENACWAHASRASNGREEYAKYLEAQIMVGMTMEYRAQEIIGSAQIAAWWARAAEAKHWHDHPWCYRQPSARRGGPPHLR